MGKIIVIIILLAILIGGAVVVYKIKRKVSQFSRAAFGTESLAKGLEIQREHLENTPKSVSGMTKIYLPRIMEDFPEFNLLEMEQKAEDALRHQLLSGENQTERYSNVQIHQTEITRYIKRSGTCAVVFQSAVEYFDERKTQTKYNTELVYIQDADKVQDVKGGGLGITCPNCGAPVTSLGAKYCEYCGSQVKELNIHIWSVGRIYEVK